MGWIVGILAGIVIGYLLDREIYFYEGVHLGPRAQAWLYDRWARKYDAGKRESQLDDAEMLARPLLEMVKDVPEPFILDFATGTGRLSFALLNQSDFTGHIVALDLSLGMLEQAASKIAGRVVPHALSGGGAEVEAGRDVSRPEARIEFLRHPSLPLPFPDGTFDAVCALEVLELFPSMDEPLKELTRVLRPGGVLLTSRGTEESGRKAKVKSKPVFTELLKRHGLHVVHVTPWWKLFDRAFAVKRGASDPAGRKNLAQVLHCRACGHADWRDEPEKWNCRTCGEALTDTASGIVLN
jgi:ubiquinone/menaquinone biosynthesis C-methylase UbiE